MYCNMSCWRMYHYILLTYLWLCDYLEYRMVKPLLVWRWPRRARLSLIPSMKYVTHRIQVAPRLWLFTLCSDWLYTDAEPVLGFTFEVIIWCLLMKRHRLRQILFLQSVRSSCVLQCWPNDMHFSVPFVCPTTPQLDCILLYNYILH